MKRYGVHTILSFLVLVASCNDSSLEKRVERLEQQVAELSAARNGGTGLAAAPAEASAPAKEILRPLPGAGDPTCCEIVPDAELKGTAGRLVVSSPEGSKAESRINYFRAGEAQAVDGVYGSLQVELHPGLYAVQIGGARREGIEIRSGCDTRVRVGVLRVSASSSSRVDLYETGGKQPLDSWYGAREQLLPAGNFELAIGGLRQPFLIEAGKIRDL